MRTFLLGSGEVILIGDEIRVQVLNVGRNTVRLVVDRPRRQPTARREPQELVCQGAEGPEASS